MTLVVLMQALGVEEVDVSYCSMSNLDAEIGWSFCFWR